MRKCVKSLISILLVFAMLMPAALPVAADNSYGFKDFPTGWSAPAMAHAVENGIIYGKSDDRIAPGDNLTRAEMAAIINRAFGATVKGDISKFKDVDPSAWYYADIQKAYNMQTIYGDAGNTMRPDDPIIREEAIAIVARAMVLSGYSASYLDKFNDKAEIADWAIDPIASMAANGYVNGDNLSNVTPKANITREEFAQLIYNIIKHYYDKNEKSSSYQGNLMLNKPGISLRDITVNGDLILGDGVGESEITLTNIDIKGRLLVRGAAQIKLTDVTTGKGVVVKNVNGTVHFDNYRDEKVFTDVAEHTNVTYKQKIPTSGAIRLIAAFTIEHYKQDLDGTYTSAPITETTSGYVGDVAGAQRYQKTFEGFTADLANSPAVSIAADGTAVLKIYYTRNQYSLTLDFGGATDVTIPTTIQAKYGETVTLPTTGFSNGSKIFIGWFDAPTGGNQITEIVMGTGVTVYAQWADTVFTVAHYKQDLNGAYTSAPETEVKAGIAGQTVSAADYQKTFEGFTADFANSPDVVVAADNSAVLNIYYTRNVYTLTFDFGGATDVTIPATIQVKYGETVTLPTTGFSNGTKPFEGWKDASGNVVTEITVGAAPVTVYAQWGDAPGTTGSFTVEHYKEKLDGTYELAETDPAQDIAIGTVLTASAYAKAYEGFTMNASASADVTVVAGTNVLKIYYTRNTYTLTYNFGGATDVTIPATIQVKYGETVTLPTTGFSYGAKPFQGWKDASGNVVATVTMGAAPVTVYAQWGSAPVTTGSYVVEHYKEKLDGTYELAETAPAQSIAIGTVLTASAYAKTYEGFTMDASASVDVTVVAGANTLKIYYTRNTYTLTYNFGGATDITIPATIQVKYGETVTLPTTGFSYGLKTFDGWFSSASGGTEITTITMGATPVTVYARWKDVVFVVAHYKQNLDGSYTSVAVTELKGAIAGTTVTADQYKKTYEGFTVDLVNSPDVVVAENNSTVLNIYYTRNTYTLTYDFGGATVVTIPQSVQVKYGETVTLPTTGFSNGSKPFEGWKDASGNVVTTVTVGAAPVTVYAQWGDEPTTTATFVVEHYKEKLDGTYELAETTPAQSIVIGAVLTANAYAKAYEGFTMDASASANVTVVAGGNTLKIYYTRNTYTLTYDFGGATVVTIPTSVQVKYGETVTLPTTGFSNGAKPFEGWKDASGNVVTTVTIGAAPVTVYAQWGDEPTTTATFVVEHYKEALNGAYELAETTPAQSVTIGTVLTVATYAKNFEGFTVDVSASANVTVVAGGNTLKIYYTRNEYTLTLDFGGATDVTIPATMQVKYGETVTLPTTGFSNGSKPFEGWKDASGNVVTTVTIGATPVTVYAQWGDEPATTAEFTVEHYKEKLDGTYELAETTPAQTAAIGTVLTANAYAKVYEGFTMDASASADVTVTAGTNVLKVYYTRNTYTLTYDFGGATTSLPTSVQVKYGETVELPTSGFSNGSKPFEGWYDEGDALVTEITMGATDATVYAKWGDAPVTTATFVVEHYKAKLDGTYELAETTPAQTAAIGTVLTAATYAKTYEGFTMNASESDDVTVVAGANTLKIYYTRNTYKIVYDFAGGTAVGSYETTFKYGQAVPLAQAKKDGEFFVAWRTQPDGGVTVSNTATINLNLITGNELRLYAWWEKIPVVLASFEVEHYKENLDGSYPFAPTETEDEQEIEVGEVLKVSDFAKTYEGFTLDTVNSVDVEVNAVGEYVLKIYYKRNVYTLNYDYCGADTTGVASATFKYGQTIDLPEEGTYSKDGFIPTGWYKTDAYIETDLVDEATKIEEIVDVNSETEATIYIKWDQFFTVTFKELGILRHTSKVYPDVSNTVPQTDIDTAYDGLVNPYIVGYRKDATVSAVYAENPYEHQLYGDWYYYEDGEYILFTNETVVDKDLTVRYMFRKAGLELNLPKLSQIIEPTFEVPFEEDTRVLDTLKDSTFLFEEKLLTAYDALDAGQKFNKANDKIAAFLASKGLEVTPGRIFADDGEILKQHVKFNGFAYLEESQVKPVVIRSIKTTFRNDPLRMRGVIDEMMQEKDPQVIDVMDSMLVSMLSGADSARIKGIIAEAVEKEVANDTTGNFKQKIKDIIVSQLNAGNQKVETSVKDAINDYFMNDANDAKIKEIVTDLINDAFATSDDSDPVRAFVMDYIKTYLNENPAVLDDMIRDMGATLDKNNPDDAHIIELIEEVLDTNVPYLEELVDNAIENLHNTVGEPVHNFIVEAIEEELLADDAELDILIDEIANANVDDLKSVLITVLDDKDTFKAIVEDAIEDEDIFRKVIKTALDNTGVFETIVRDLCNTDEAFYKMLVDIALSSTTLTDNVKDIVVDDEDALVTMLKEVASDPALKAEMVEEILIAVDDDLKDQLTNPIDVTSEYYVDVKAKALKQAEAEIINIVESGINEIDHPEYWPVAFAKAMEVAEANVVNNLIALGVDPNGSLWDSAYASAMDQAKIDVTAELNGGIDDSSIYYDVAVNGAKAQAATEINALLATGIAEGSKYWNVAYTTAQAILKEEVETNFESKIDELKADGKLAQVKTWAQNSLNDPEVEDVIKTLVKDLATSTEPEDIDLKADIIDSVIDTIKNANQLEKEGLVDDIINELLKPANATIKAAVAAKAIDVLNLDENAAVKSEIVDGVLDDILSDATLKGDLIADLKAKVKDPAQAAFRLTVVDKAIDAVINDSIVNHRAIVIINNLIETDPAFKAETIAHIVDYILEDSTARAEAMEKVIAMIEDPGNTSHKDEAIDFAFNTLKGDTARREEIANKFLTSILSDKTKRQDMATDVVDIMFKNVSLRDRILDLGFEQMFSNTETIKEVVELALEELLSDDGIRREMILAVIETESGRDSILDILFDELERDATLLDKIVDLAMAGKYGDMVDKFVYDLINLGEIEINPDNRQITEEIIIPMLDDMTLETVMSKLPAKVSDVLPESKIETIFNKFKAKAREKLVEGVEEAAKGNSKAIKVMIDHDIDVINGILVPAYNKVFPKVIDKAEDFYYYNENQYIKAIVDMLDPEVIFEKVTPSEMGTGYRVRDSRYYYEMLRNTLVLADDAGQWYLDNISDEQIDKVISKFMSAYTKVITKANSVAGGRIPEDKLETIIGYVEKAIDKRQNAYDVTTTSTFEVVDKVYHKMTTLVKDKIGIDLPTGTVIELALDGTEVTLRVDDRSVNIDAESVTVGGKTVNIGRFVEKVADKFGTKSIKIKLCEDVPYSYELSVKNYSVRLSAFYEG